MGILMSCLVSDDTGERTETDPGQPSAEEGKKPVQITNLSGVNSVAELKRSRDAQNSQDEENPGLNRRLFS